jgi:2-polyprenyl-6-methoxyphenol hydroxylase-like FAD-dependent oxidoreductase
VSDSHRLRTFAVIGAGPAGCAAAIGLADRGYRVTVYESRPFPRTKVCGEYISPAATGVLESLIGAEALERAGAVRTDRYVLQWGDRTREWRTPSAAWALSRRSLDTLLVERAAQAGVEVRQPTKVHAVRYGDERVELTLADGGVEVADAVVHADGSGRHDPAGPTPMIEGVVGHKCHLRLPESGPESGSGSGFVGAGAVGMRAGPGAYVGTIRVEGGLSTVALVAGRRHIARHRGDADAMLAALWPGFDPAWREGNWLSCGVARSKYIEPGHPHSVRLGNAAGAVDPVGGEGIGLGLWAGASFAELLGERAEEAGLARAKQELARAYRERLRWRRVSCGFGAGVLMRPSLVRALWPMLGVAPGLTIRPWYRMTGKPG